MANENAEAKVAKFTHRAVLALKHTTARRTVWEAAAHGQGNLGLRLAAAPGVAKSWIYMFRFSGKARMMTLGQFPEMTVEQAHAAAAAAGQQRATGLDPAATTVAQNRAEREAPTVAELAALYIEKYAVAKKSGDRDVALLNRNVLPVWGPHKASAITRKDLAALLDDMIARNARIQANRTRAVISRMYSWGDERGIVTGNPVQGTRAPVKEVARDRALTRAELGRVLTRVDAAAFSNAAKLALKFLVATAARPSEACEATWAEIDLDERLWTLPATRTKNGRLHRIPLSAYAVAVLCEARKLDRGAGAVFPSPQHGKCGPISAGALAHAVQKSLGTFAVSQFHPHDLRRTASTLMNEIGVQPQVVDALTNHARVGVSWTYNRYSYDAEKRDAVDRWAVVLGQLSGWEAK